MAPGLHHTELAQRRQNLANLMPPGSMAVIPAASLAFVTGVIPYPYRQDADFLYLTGLQQQAVALIQAGGERGLKLSQQTTPAAPANTQLVLDLSSCRF